ncbi:unnamed protein product, partial [marine sediment metagenome]
VEHGKSEILKKFAFVNTVKITSDFNSFIFADFVAEYQAGTKRTILIPDFLRVVKRKQSTQASNLTILNSVTEEGWVGKLPLGQHVGKPVTANLITALTESELGDRRYKWSRFGFLSRVVPLTFKYGEDTAGLIRSYIKDRLYHQDNPYDFELPKDKIDVAIPPDVSEMVQELCFVVMDRLKVKNMLGFRLQRQLQVLTMASAISNGRNLVNSSDFEAVKEISAFINYKYKEI